MTLTSKMVKVKDHYVDIDRVVWFTWVDNDAGGELRIQFIGEYLEIEGPKTLLGQFAKHFETKHD